jgi:regulator of ribonuclease activity A
MAVPRCAAPCSGGNLGAAAARNGWAGVLVNGCVRDVAELLPLPIGILALAPHADATAQARTG